MPSDVLIYYALSELRKLFILVGLVGMFFAGFGLLYALDKGRRTTKELTWCTIFFILASIGFALPDREILDRFLLPPTAEVSSPN